MGFHFARAGGSICVKIFWEMPGAIQNLGAFPFLNPAFRMPTLFYGAIVVLVAAGFQILMALRRGQISRGRGLLYAGITLVGALGLVHGGASYFTWMYKDKVAPQVVAALQSSPLSSANFGAAQTPPTIKVIDYSPYGGHALATFSNGNRYSVRFKPADGDSPAGGAVTPAEYTWLGL